MVQHRRKFTVLLQRQRPKSGHCEWIRGFEPTFSRFLKVAGDVIVGKCLKLKVSFRLLSDSAPSSSDNIIVKLSTESLQMERHNVQLQFDC
jgi:hypothetical protein